MMKKEDLVRLENWSIITSDDSKYSAPELRVKRLKGMSYGHPQFPDGEVIHTSPLINEVDVVNGIAETVSRVYCLGEMDPEYAAFLKENQDES